MQNIQFPVNFKFKVTSFSNDFTATDASGKVVAYVKQKMFKLKEDINVYNDETKTKVNYKIKADRWLDFSAAYAFYDENNNEIGKIARKGWRSIWKASYDIIDDKSQIKFTVNEENGWVKVLDSIFGQIPILSIFTGYFFNPSYLVKTTAEVPVVRLTKQPSFFGRNFELNKLGSFNEEDDDRVMLGTMMMILLERSRG